MLALLIPGVGMGGSSVILVVPTFVQIVNTLLTTPVPTDTLLTVTKPINTNLRSP